jgi:L-fuculose-phosphate aldolase
VHQAIYRRHPEIGSIINAYPVNATAFGVTGAPLDSRTIPESYIVIRQVARVPFGLQFEDPWGMAEAISVKQPAALLDNDGVMVTGVDILQAFDRLEVLESTAEAIINTCPIGKLEPMPVEVTRELDRVFLKE